MAKRKKKNAITMVSLLLALVVLIGVYVWYSNKGTEKDNTDDTKSISLEMVDPSKVTAFHYVGADADMNFVLKDGVWQSKEEPDRPINQDNINNILNTISNITAMKLIEDSPSNLADFGLDAPKPYIEVTLADGSKMSFKVGVQAASGEGYYAMVNDNNKVYLVDNSYNTGLTYTNLSMTKLVNGPAVKAENINYINVEKRDSENVELKLMPNGANDNSGYGASWQYLKPYGDGYTADSNAISTLLQNYTSFNYTGCVDYKGDDLAKYGLDKPAASITVGYYETDSKPTPTPSTSGGPQSQNKVGKIYKIYIGNKTEDGNYYVRVNDLNSVYLLLSTTVDAMLNVDPFTQLNKYAAIPNVLKVDKVTAEINGTTYAMTVKTTKTKDKENNEVIKQSFTFNGKDAEEETFKTLYRSLVSVMYDSQLNEKVDITKLKPVLKLSFHLTTDDSTISLTCLPYNDSFYIVDKGTGKYFLADKRKVDLVVSNITKFK
jgi:hypothetical protein